LTRSGGCGEAKATPADRWNCKTEVLQLAQILFADKYFLAEKKKFDVLVLTRRTRGGRIIFGALSQLRAAKAVIRCSEGR
jgi:hypothetical protein